MDASFIFLEAPTYNSGGADALSVAAADVNGDGHPDLLVANACSSSGNCGNGSVSVLLGNGDGTFQAAVSYNSGGAYDYSVAVADVNGDGHPDLLVTNQCASIEGNCNNGTVSVLLGNGDGTFQAAVSYNSGGGGAFSVAVADVNGDGHPDLLVTNQCASISCNNGSVSVLLGNGDGTFQAAVSYNSGGKDAISVAVADVNGDGHPDLLVTNVCTSSSNCTNGSVGVLLGNGDGTFQTAVSYNSGAADAYSVAVADVNGDGHPDLLVTNQCASREGNCNNGSVSVLLGNGDGTFQAPASYNSAGEYAYSVAVADVNGDGHPDLLVANLCDSSGNCANGGSVSVLLGNGDGTFQAAVSYNSGGDEAYSVAVADVNGDGHPDLLVANVCASSSNCNGTVGVLLGKGDGTFQPAVTYSSEGADANSVAVADVNGDGHPDLLVLNDCASSSNCTNGTVGVLLGNGDGTFQPAMTYSSGGYSASSLAVADVNGDGHPDLLVANVCDSSGNCANGGSVSVLLGNGDGTFQAAVSYNSGAYIATSVAVADVNGDGHPDLLVANECASSGCSNGTNGMVGVLLGNGDGTFQAAVSYNSGGYLAISVAVADVNGDGHPDLLVANQCASSYCAANGTIGVLLGNGDGTFQTALTTQTPSLAGQIAVADFNGDGKLDAAIGSGSVLLLGNGDGTFQTPLNLGAEGGGTAVGDFNGDGRPDLAVGGVTVLLNISTGFSVGTTTTLTSSANPASFGQSVTFTATVTANGSGTPSGTVTFLDGANQIGTGTLSGGQATFTTSALSVSSHSITAAYGGSSGFQSSTSSPLTQVVNQAATTINVTGVNPSSEAYGQDAPVTITAVLSWTGSGAAPTAANVTIAGNGPSSYGATSCGAPSGTTITCTATYTPTTADTPGSYTETAKFSGDSNYTGSTSPQTANFVINDASSTVSVSSNPNPSTYGQTVTFTATISGEYGDAKRKDPWTPRKSVRPQAVSGTVTWSANTGCGTTPVTSGAATCTTSSLTAGSDTVSANYSGDSNHNPGSGSVSQTVNQAATTTTVASSMNPAPTSQTVTYTATVTGAYGGALGGTVTFEDGNTTIGSAALVSGTASVKTSYTVTGTHLITATYSGDANDVGGVSPTLTEYIEHLPVATTTTVTSSGSPSLIGQPVTFTATVSSAYGAIPNGETVNFYDGTTSIGSGATTSGVATLTTSSLSAKTHTIKATYAGDHSFKTSSGTVVQIVNLYPTTTTLTSSLNPSAYGQAVELTATVSSSAPSGPTGTVTFKNGSTTLGTGTLSSGAAQISTTKIPVGSYSLTAVYNGDAENAKSTSPGVSQTVNPATISMTLTSSPNPTSPGEYVTFTATLTSNGALPTGKVTFTYGTTTLGTAAINSKGIATLSTKALPAGMDEVTASYPGSTDFSAATASVAQTVN